MKQMAKTILSAALIACLLLGITAYASTDGSEAETDAVITDTSEAETDAVAIEGSETEADAAITDGSGAETDAVATDGSGADADAVATASISSNQYTNLDQAGVLETMEQFAGLCNVATVNEDGSPNLAIFVPGVADDSHIMFVWSDNATKTNVLRDKEAVITYDIANLAADTKAGRHTGAILKVALEEDQDTLDAIREANTAITDVYVIMKIVEVLPIG